MVDSKYHSNIRSIDGLGTLSDDDIFQVMSESHLVTLEKEERLCDDGLAIIIGGTLKAMIYEGEHTLMLYRVLRGELTILTSPSTLMNTHINIMFKASGRCELLIIPVSLSARLESNYPELHEVINRTLAMRLDKIIDCLDSLVFNSIGQRLTEYLEKESIDGIVHLTHREIAKDIGTGREIVSRILKKMEKEGKVVLSHGEIRILSIPAYSTAKPFIE